VTTWRQARSRTAAWLAVIAAVALLVSGYAGVSAASDEPEQLSYLVSGGLGSLLLLGIGATLLLTSDLADQHRKLLELAAATGSEPVSARNSGGRVALLTAWAVSGALLFAGWEQAAAASDLDRDGATQGVPLAMVALVVTAVAGSVATIGLRRRVEAEKGHLLPALATALVPGPAQAAAAPAHPTDDGLVTGPGLTRYHRPTCPTLAGIPAVPVPARPDPALRACRICDAPDQTDSL
jgi:hypothetical protein